MEDNDFVMRILEQTVADGVIRVIALDNVEAGE
jgi:hypothetical protein